MIRKILKWTGIGLAVLFVFGCGFFYLLIRPGLLFPEAIEHGNLVVHSSEPIDPSAVRAVLLEVEAALAASEIDDPSLTHEIVLGHDNTAFRKLQGMAFWLASRRGGTGRALTFNRALPPYTSQVITFRIPRFEDASLLHPQTDRALSMVHLFAHEAAHSLIAARVGAEQAARLPAWKKEGYAEYVAASKRILGQPDYDFEESVERILQQGRDLLLDPSGQLIPIRYDCVGRSTIEDELGNAGPGCYYVSRVLVEFLMDFRGLSFEEMVRPGPSDTATFREMLRAYHAGEL